MRSLFGRREEKISELDRILGAPRGAILYMMAVMIVPYIISRLNIFVDTAWVAELGPDAVTAVSVVKPLYIIISCVGVGFGIGASACISCYIGRKKIERAEDIATNAVLCGIFISVGISLILLVFIGPILYIIGAENVQEQAREYMFPLSTCASILISSGILTSILKAEGAAKKVMVSVLLGAVVNIVLDPIMIFTLGLGIAGAAWATSISSMCTILLIYYWYYTGRTCLRLRIIRRPERSSVREILSIATPRALEEFSSGVFLLLQRMIIMLVAGSEAVMMHTLAFLYLDLLMVIPDALGSSALTVGSVCIGQRDQEKLDRGVNFTVYLGFGIPLIMSLVLFMFPEQLMAIFINPETEPFKEEIIWATRLYSLLLPFYVMTKITSYLLQVIRKSKLSASFNVLIGVVKTLFNAIPLVLGLYTFEAVVWSIAGGYLAAAVIMMLVTVIQYRKFDINSLDLEPAKARS